MTFVRSRQGLVWSYAAVLAVVLFGLAVTGTASSTEALPALGILAVIGIVVALLSQLGVSILDDRLSVWLGPGMFRQEYRLSDIAGIDVVDVTSPFAVGLRLLPDGWLYSLGGHEFTEVRLVGGRRVLIGLGADTGLPEGLRRTLRG